MFYRTILLCQKAIKKSVLFVGEEYVRLTVPFIPQVEINPFKGNPAIYLRDDDANGFIIRQAMTTFYLESIG